MGLKISVVWDFEKFSRYFPNFWIWNRLMWDWHMGVINVCPYVSCRFSAPRISSEMKTSGSSLNNCQIQSASSWVCTVKGTLSSVHNYYTQNECIIYDPNNAYYDLTFDPV